MPSDQPPLPPSDHHTTGFPSPAAEDADLPLDLHALLVQHPAATYFARMTGDAMAGVGLYEGDILVVDRALDPLPGALVVAVVDGGAFLVRRYVPQDDRATVLLVADGVDGLPAEPPLSFPLQHRAERQLVVWGIVTAAIHTTHPGWPHLRMKRLGEVR